MHINISGTRINKVPEFKYLGRSIDGDLNHDLEIRARIETARAKFLKMQNLLSDRSVDDQIRYNLVKYYIYSILLYGVGKWLLKVYSLNRLEVFLKCEYTGECDKYLQMLTSLIWNSSNEWAENKSSSKS